MTKPIIDITLHILATAEDPKHPEETANKYIDTLYRSASWEGIRVIFGEVAKISQEAARIKYYNGGPND